MSPTNYSPKEEALHNLKLEMKKDESLPLKESNLVFGEGSPEAEVVFIGEAPGYHENLKKRPFIGRAGKLLTVFVEGIGWRREDVYITNIVKRRPPENRDPSPEEIAAYVPYLIKQVETINPKIIAPLGRFSMNFFLPMGKISRDQGKVFWWEDKLVVPLYHPAAALRSTTVKEELKKSFVRLPMILKKYEKFLEEKSAKKETPEETEHKPQQTKLF